MKTFLVSGNDTGIGKTWTIGSLARILCDQGCSVQIVKPVETGVSDGDESDADRALRRCGSDRASCHVLRRYRAPLAPTSAAVLEGASLRFEDLVAEVLALPDADFRLVEGAGSLAVPFNAKGQDWTDFALGIGASKLVLVVDDRLGAIGQARMVYSYAQAKGMDSGVWLNQIQAVDAETRQSTFETLRELGIPLWGRQALGEPQAEILKPFWS